MTSVSLFDSALGVNQKLISFYQEKNPAKARDLRKQQEAIGKRLNEGRYVNVTYDADRQQAAKARLDELKVQVDALTRPGAKSATFIANKMADLTKKMAAAMVDYIRAGGGRKDLVPGEEGAPPPEEDPFARPKPLSTFLINDAFGVQLRKMTEALEALAKKTNAFAQLKRDSKGLEALADSRKLLRDLRDEFRIIRNIRVNIDIEV